MYFVTPWGALFRGLVAGAVGSYVQDVYFKRTKRLAPSTPKDVFTPPEEEQKSEFSTATVARRTVEGMLKRGPLSESQKKTGGKIVHYAYGAAWGGLYGLTRESLPATRHPLGVLAYSAGVWMLADNVIPPAFRLAAWPQKYPAKVHAYALSAHVAFGVGTALFYEVMRRQSWDAVGAAVWALGARRKINRFLPRRAKPAARFLIRDMAWVYAHRPIDRARAAARA